MSNQKLTEDVAELKSRVRSLERKAEVLKRRVSTLEESEGQPNAKSPGDSTKGRSHTLTFRIESFEEVIFDGHERSPLYYTGDIPWEINVRTKIFEDDTWLGVYLRCRDSSVGWSHKVRYELKIIKANGSILASRKDKAPTMFSERRVSFGWAKLTPLSGIIDPLDDVLGEDGTLTVEATIQLL